jgi:predicted TIM-barrel fold metal-dependent hydrolase
MNALPTPTSPLPTANLSDSELQGFGIWDLHCHPVQGDSSYKRMENLVSYADRMGVERMCIYMAWPFPSTVDATPDQFRQDNDEIIAILKDWGTRAFGFVFLNPHYPKECLYELERCVAEGPMVGVKLWVGWKCNRPELDPIIKRAAELKALVFQHCWYKSSNVDPLESTPQDLVELSSRHPGVPMVCGHTGGNWELGIRSIRGHPEIYSGLAGSEPTAGYVEMAVRELGANRVLYGSDVEGRSFASQLAKVTGADITPEQKRMILRDNLRNLLLPILQSKGIKA